MKRLKILLAILLVTAAATASAAETSGPVDVRKLVFQLQHEDKTTMQEAGSLLLELVSRRYEEIAPALFELASHPEERVRFDALSFVFWATMVGSSHTAIDDTHADVLLVAVDDESSRVAVVAIETLSVFPGGTPERAIPRLLAHASGEDAKRREAAVVALARVHPPQPSVTAALLQRLETTADPRFTAAILRTLSSTAGSEGRVQDACAPLLRHPDAGVRFNAGACLMHYQATAAAERQMPVFRALAADDPDRNVRTLAQELIAARDPIPDFDRDGVPNDRDNCLYYPNGPGSSGVCEPQVDSDRDGFGNPCDMDLDNDGTVSFDDRGVVPRRDRSSDPRLDFDCDGDVDDDDRARMDAAYRQAPGPSGLACAGTIPCSAP